MSANDRDIAAIEEGRAEPIVGEQANETSRNNGQITEQHTPSLLEDIKERLKSFGVVFINEDKGDERRSNSSISDSFTSDEEVDERRVNTPMIPRVPIELRENDNLKKYFEPRVVSIGPYHHENTNLKVKERMKRKLAAMFIKKHLPGDKFFISLWFEMNIKKLREWYEMETVQHYNDEDLAWMFLIDGCVVLHFLHSDTHEIGEVVIDKNELHMDLLLLENQLPSQVLNMLMSSSKDRDDLMTSIEKFIHSNTRTVTEKNQKQSIKSSAHLLDLMRKTYLVKSFRYYNYLWEIYFNITFRNNENFSSIGRTDTPIDVQTMQKLTLAGIELKPTNTGSLAEVTFCDGTLMLPFIEVDNSTEFKFLNLIAYEIVSDLIRLDINFCYPVVSAYIFFLTSLVTQAQDVDELQVNKILNNNFASNKEVVKLFKELSTVDFPESFKSLHSQILKDIREYLDDPSKRKSKKRFSIVSVVRLFVCSDYST